MVCLGNICRSPMAEALLRHHAEKRGLTLSIDSAGTSDFHKGNTPDERMTKTANSHGVDITYIRSRPLSTEDFTRFDHIFVMDRSNLKNVLRLCNAQEHANKVSLIMDKLFPGDSVEVPDPYFGSEDGFEKVFNMLNDACIRILDEITAD
jgi:protein-tyrosine phosphatase